MPRVHGLVAREQPQQLRGALEGFAVHDRVVEGLFVNLPLKIIGATGSWIRPALIV